MDINTKRKIYFGVLALCIYFIIVLKKEPYKEINHTQNCQKDDIIDFISNIDSIRIGFVPESHYGNHIKMYFPNNIATPVFVNNDLKNIAIDWRYTKLNSVYDIMHLNKAETLDSIKNIINSHHSNCIIAVTGGAFCKKYYTTLVEKNLEIVFVTSKDTSNFLFEKETRYLQYLGKTENIFKYGCSKDCYIKLDSTN